MGNVFHDRARVWGILALVATVLCGWTEPASAERWFGDLLQRVSLKGPTLSMVSVDANQDGLQDLVVATAGSMTSNWSGLEVVTSNRGGGMAVTARIESTLLLGGLVVGDFNEDGIDDVAGAPGHGNPAPLTLFAGDGAGGFSPVSHTPLPSVSGHSPALHDFNGDGHLDLALLGSGGAVSLLLGDGSGQFTCRELELPFNAMTLAAGDLDGDGLADLALAGHPRRSGAGSGARVGLLSSRSPGTPPGPTVRRMAWLASWLGDGEGGFVEGSMERIPEGPRALSIQDLNGDSVPDIGVASRGIPGAWNSTLGVLIGTGNGGFLELDEYEITPIPWSLGAADVNGDGLTDLIGSGGKVGVLRADGNGGFAAWEETDIMGGAITVDDFNGDGAVDIVIARPKAGVLTILKGNGDGGWVTPPAGLPVGEMVRAATSADFDQDGALDVAALVEEKDASRVVLLLNRAGSLVPSGPGIVLDSEPLDVAAGDFNDDGAADLALADVENERLSILHGDGAGGFLAGPSIGIGMPRTITVGDVDDDGRDDLVVTLLRDSSTAVLTEDRQGQLEVLARIPNGTRGQPAQIGDLDSDGHADLLSVDIYDRELRLALSDGKGGFLPVASIALDHHPGAVILTNIDDDGQPDVIVAHPQQSSVSVFASTRGGLSGGPELLRVRGEAEHLAAGDFDGDGRDDLVVAGHSDRSLAFIPGDAQPLAIATAVEAFSIRSVIAAADFDRDGVDDLAVVGPGEGRITILGGRAR